MSTRLDTNEIIHIGIGEEESYRQAEPHLDGFRQNNVLADSLAQ
jgi:hypothetical protein